MKRRWFWARQGRLIILAIDGVPAMLLRMTRGAGPV